VEPLTWFGKGCKQKGIECNHVVPSKLLENFVNFWTRREAESSIRIQEGPPLDFVLKKDSICHPTDTTDGFSADVFANFSREKPREDQFR
jgi:hypothetical protein